MPNPLFTDWRKINPEDEPIDYSQLMSRPEQMNMTPVGQAQIPVSEELIKYDKLRAPANADITAPEPQLDASKLRSPEAKKMLYDSLLSKKESPMSEDDSYEAKLNEELIRADERADRDRSIAGYGSALDTLVRAIGGGRVERNPFYDNIMKDSDKYRKNVLDRKKMLQDYLSKKIEDKRLQSDLSYKNAMLKNQQEELNLKKQEMGLKTQKQLMELPEGVKESATSVSKDIANKVSISQQIDANVSEMESALASGDKDKALQLGRQMIKVLNSTQGQDAVGQEESRRLGGKLEIAFGGLTTGNPGQFGRDLEGFVSDAKSTSDAVKSAAGALKETYKGTTGREHPMPIPKRSSDLTQYSAPQERMIQKAMSANPGASREEIIKAAKAAGKL